MKNALLLIIILMTLSSALLAQKNDATPYQSDTKTKLFNPETIEAFTASVISISTIIEADKPHYGIHLNVKNDTETISVHLGPSWYLDEHKVTFEVGDNLVIRGSRIVYEGIPEIIAMEVQKKETMLILRDKKGFPNWRGWQNSTLKKNKPKS